MKIQTQGLLLDRVDESAWANIGFVRHLCAFKVATRKHSAAGGSLSAECAAAVSFMERDIQMARYDPAGPAVQAF